MITKYFTNINVAFNPFSPAARVARIFINNIPPKSRMGLKVKTTVLSSEIGQEISVTFKDGHVIKIDPKASDIDNVMSKLDRHSRSLKIKEDIER
ncbi:mitochondrial ribosomal protein l44 [Nadsonia fulvescens var. elongata DSM 6958]|uniref:Large ribosomal subunit protein mL53 n=1 Tax=Nadsonia fulvescens var. elongata DSM 6958 TaxID=857566 RepID=A0A1E3PK00_9ASCO|nr:mitochondrial ribosomal protein l44 [Nadsonia fulvescens var. elongata DSM 6958]